MKDNSKAPTPALPCKQESEFFHRHSGARVKRANLRCAIAHRGISRSHLNFEIPDRSALADRPE
jgi:hypothetical protein